MCHEWKESGYEKSDQFKEHVIDVCSNYFERHSNQHPEVDFLLSWHFDVFNSVVPVPYFAGNFRGEFPGMPCLNQQVYVDSIPGTIPPMVTREMKQLFKKLHSELALLLDSKMSQAGDRNEKAAYCIASFIGTFIKIHPYINGNGRSSRFLLNWLFSYLNVNLSFIFASRPGRPYGDIMRSCMQGNNSLLYLQILRDIQVAGNPQTE